MKKRLFSFIKFFFGWPLSILAVIFIGKSVFSKGSVVLSQLHGVNLWFLGIGIISFLVYFFLRGYSWQKILHVYDHRHLSFEETNLLWAKSEVRRYIPGNIWSFFSRAYLFEAKKVPKVDTSKGLLIEGEMIVIGGAVVSLLSVPFFWRAFFSSGISPFTLWTSILVILGGVCLYIFQTPILKKLSLRENKLVSFVFPMRSAQEYFELVLLSVGSFFFFGLGYYFATISVVSFSPQIIWQLVGIFVLSYLGGYLSLITPSGLGVREGIITFSLTKITSLELAGFIALFSRFILVLAEVIFLGVSYLMYSLRNTWMKVTKKYLVTYRYEVLLVVAIVIYIVYFTIASFLRYDNFYTGRFDLGNMAQTVWNTSHGRIFQLTDPNGVDTVSRLSTHADFILILLAPFYFFWSNPKMLLLIQTIVMGLGAIFVYKIAKYVLNSAPIALIFGLLYLLNPSVQRSNLYDFHAVTLATTFLLAAFYFLLKKRVGWFLVFAILAALTKEHIWLILALFGLYMAIFQKKRLLGGILFFSGTGIFYYLVTYAIPQALGAKHFALAYYSDYGDSPAKIIKNIIFSPLKTISTILQPDRLTFLRQLAGPLGYLVILSPLYLIFAGPDFIIDLLSNNPQLHQIYYQYTATITPFLFISAMYGIALLWKYAPAIPKITPVLWLLVFGIYGLYAYGPLPGSKESNLDMFTKPLPNKVEVDQFLSHIPKRYSIAASNNVGSHLSQRQQIYTLPIGIDRADMIILLPDSTTPQLSLSQQAFIASISANPKYTLFYQKDKFIVFKKR